MTYKASAISADESASFTVSAETGEPLKAEEEVRLIHHLEAVAKAAARRYVRHVATWGAQKIALKKLTAEDAEVLGLSKDWQEARKVHAWGNGFHEGAKMGRPRKVRP